MSGRRKKGEKPHHQTPLLGGWLLGIHTFKAELVTLGNSGCTPDVATRRLPVVLPVVRKVFVVIGQIERR